MHRGAWQKDIHKQHQLSDMSCRYNACRYRQKKRKEEQRRQKEEAEAAARAAAAEAAAAAKKGQDKGEPKKK